MTGQYRPKGPWINRFGIRFFALLWALLIFWALGFLVDDIKSLPGPDYAQIEARYLDKALITQQQQLEGKIQTFDRQLTTLQDEQQLLTQSSQNLQQTINQLLQLQRLSLQKDIALSATEQNNLNTSLNRFLENQQKFQELNQTIAARRDQKRSIEDQRNQIEQQLQRQRQPAKAEFERLNDQHRLKLASLQLLVLVPLLVVSGYLITRQRSSRYFPLVLAFGGATLLKIILVVQEYFPARWLQYLLMAALLLVVGRVLIYFINSVVAPKKHFVIQQFREAYQSFLCPVCEYPIQMGPRRYLFWTRRTVNKIILPRDGENQEETYTCPSCGTPLFERCSACDEIRHSLLPHCHHCGAEKPVQ